MHTLRRLLLQCLLLLSLYEFVRLLFWLVNRSQFQTASWNILLEAFAQGARYDLSAIALTNGALFLLYLLPVPLSWMNWQERLVAVLGGLINGFFLGLNVVDIEYYRFTGKRFTWDSFAIGKDILGQIVQVSVYYWYYTALILTIGFGFIWLSLRILKRQEREKLWSRMASTLAVLALAALAGRGGWQHKPLIPAQAYAGDTGTLGILILNSSFTLLKSSDKALLRPLAFMKEEQARQILVAKDAGEPVELIQRPKNVILVIMESFGKEYVFPPQGKPSYTPFLQSLALKGSSFPQAFANGRRSIDALPAILAGVPAWMDSPFITSPYQTNRLMGFPRMLKEHGYRTQFFHGGDNGTMFFDVMAGRFGFSEYIGAKEYPDQRDHDGRWGIFDEPFLQYTVKRLGEDPKPFFATLFTLSSHHPYTIPEAHKNRFPKGTLEIHESLGYSDYAMQKFYESSAQEPWFKDTLFIFTADHTQKTEYPEYETIVGHFRVPMIFIMNDRPLPFPDYNRPVQHMDIMPTVLDALGVELHGYPRFGSSLLRTDKRPGIVLNEGPRYILFGKNSLLSWNMETDQIHSYDWPRDTLLKSEQSFTQKSSFDFEFLKAQVQCFNNGMVQNTLLW